MLKTTRERASQDAIIQRRPEARVAPGGHALVQQLRTMSFAESESALSPAPDGHAVQMKASGGAAGGGLVSGGARLVEVQTALNEQGYDCGTPDGQMGPHTRAAVVAFQRDHGLAPDGLIGPATLRAIEMDAGGGMQAGRVALEMEEKEAEGAEGESEEEGGGGMQAGRIALELEEQGAAAGAGAAAAGAAAGGLAAAKSFAEVADILRAALPKSATVEASARSVTILAPQGSSPKPQVLYGLSISGGTWTWLMSRGACFYEENDAVRALLTELGMDEGMPAPAMLASS